MVSDSRLDRVAANHRGWFAARAAVAGGPVVETDAVTMAVVPGRDLQVWSETRDGPGVRNEADAARSLAREHDLAEIGWWSATGDGSAVATGTALLGRGFTWGWQPQWMWLELDRLVPYDVPPGITLRRLETDVRWKTDDLYLYDPEHELRIVALAEQGVTYIAAFDHHDRPVGLGAVYAPPGGDTAGLYNCGVVPDQRNRGIGRALTSALCRYAADQRHRAVSLNATPLGLPMYTRVGFEPIGRGQTWWAHRTAIDTAIDPASRDLVEAIGAGDPIGVERIVHGRPGATDLDADLDLDAVLPCGHTPLVVAVHTRRPEVVRRLVDLGASPDALSDGTAPLHVAAEQGNAELVEALLDAGASRKVRDAAVNATPLDWARHFGHQEIARLLSRRGPRRSGSRR